MEVDADADGEQVGGWLRSDWQEGTSEETGDELLRDWEGRRGRSLRSEQRSCRNSILPCEEIGRGGEGWERMGGRDDIEGS